MYFVFLIKNMMMPSNQPRKSVIKRDADNAYCPVWNIPNGTFCFSSVMKVQTELEFKLNVI